MGCKYLVQKSCRYNNAELTRIYILGYLYYLAIIVLHYITVMRVCGSSVWHGRDPAPRCAARPIVNALKSASDYVLEYFTAQHSNT